MPDLATLGQALGSSNYWDRARSMLTGSGPIQTSTGITITPQDIGQGINLGMGFSGGGLSVGETPETILSAAVKYKGKIYPGANHFEAIGNAAKANGIPFRSAADQ